jgi:MFS family permease
LQYKWIVLSNTTLGTLMASLDTNIVLIALPTISRELRATSFFDLLWILLGYQLVNGSLLVNFGRLSDMFGRVRLYTFGFALFTAASAPG